MRVAMLALHSSPVARPGGRNTGGMNVYVRELSARLAARGHEVDVFTAGGPQADEVAPGVRLLRLGVDFAGDAYAPALPALLEAAREVATGRRYDLVHSHYWVSAWVGERLAAEWSVPQVVMFHTLAQVKLRARLTEREAVARIEAEDLAVRHADAIVAATEDERRQLVRWYGAERERVHIIPCGVDTARFRPVDRAAARAYLGLPECGAIVLYVGRLEPLKGVDLFIEAAGRIEWRDVTVLVVGGDDPGSPHRAELEARARELGLGERVRFVGSVPHEDLPAYYSAADVTVVPSYYESFGLVAVESMACGTPVVASRVGGLTGTVLDGRTGYLVPWRCPEPFADRIETLLANEELREGLGRAGVEAVQQYAWERIAERIDELYRELVAGSACGSGRRAGAPVPCR